MSTDEIRRLLTERVPAPAGVTLGGLPVVWFELLDGRVGTATLTPAGDIKMVEGTVVPPAGTEDAVLEAALLRAPQERGSDTTSGGNAG